MAKIDNLLLKYRVPKVSAKALRKIDPSPQGKYLEWLFKHKYTKDNSGKYKVSPRFPANLHLPVAYALAWLEKNPTKLDVKYRDINAFKSVSAMLKVVQPLMVPSKSEIKNQVVNVFEDEKWLIIVPKTFEASKLYGMGTKWCTTQKTYFNQYNRSGILFYLIDKTCDRKFGFTVSTTGNNLNTNPNSTTFYNNEDSSLGWGTLSSVYGRKTLDVLWGKVNEHCKSVVTDILKKRVLEDSVSRLRTMKRELYRNKIYKNDKVDGLLKSLQEELNKSLISI